jgi:F-type H+-transporting ATPase subunit a
LEEAMTELFTSTQWQFTLGGSAFTLNAETVIMTWVVAGIILLLAYVAVRRLSMVPGPAQNVAEMLVEGFMNLSNASLGRRGPGYFPLILATFIFVLISNWLGVIPFLSEPTRDLNTTLGLALIGFFTAHYAAIRTKGIKRYLKSYFEPFPLMFPLNVIGEVSKVISISFRLYGNVMGGAVIILVVSKLVHYWLLPPLLYAFFGFFVGTIQAFVFAMLTLTYISLAIQD